MICRRLGPDDAAQYRTLRISGLRESPTAFIVTAEEEEQLPLAVTLERLQQTPASATYGAYQVDQLVGICTVLRESRSKLRHKATLVGVYVAAQARRAGTARELIRQALGFAAAMGVRQVNLGVNAANIPALRLYESLGFVPYGTEREFMCVDGMFQDEIYMVHVLP
ncbi:MAG TPA: GNAT family protein [Povalibacter sp.]